MPSMAKKEELKKKAIAFDNALSRIILALSIVVFIGAVVVFVQNRAFGKGVFGSVLVAVVLFIISYLLRFRKVQK